MDKTRPFRLLAFMTYVPMPLLGIMIIFGFMGKVMEIGWLESAPDVLLIPTLLAYYISLIFGAIYGYLKNENKVYQPALAGVGAWIIGMIFSAFLSLSDSVMIVINSLFVVVFLAMHILQYMATRKWENRILSSKN
ncbi:MAG: hypothetical protein V3V99_02690 [candidate division Zixibacteria bacterium]